MVANRKCTNHTAHAHMHLLFGEASSKHGYIHITTYIWLQDLDVPLKHHEHNHAGRNAVLYSRGVHAASADPLCEDQCFLFVAFW